MNTILEKLKSLQRWDIFILPKAQMVEQKKSDDGGFLHWSDIQAIIEELEKESLYVNVAKNRVVDLSNAETPSTYGEFMRSNPEIGQHPVPIKRGRYFTLEQLLTEPYFRQLSEEELILIVGAKISLMDYLKLEGSMSSDKAKILLSKWANEESSDEQKDKTFKTITKLRKPDK